MDPANSEWLSGFCRPAGLGGPAPKDGRLGSGSVAKRPRGQPAIGYVARMKESPSTTARDPRVTEVNAFFRLNVPQALYVPLGQLQRLQRLVGEAIADPGPEGIVLDKVLDGLRQFNRALHQMPTPPDPLAMQVEGQRPYKKSFVAAELKRCEQARAELRAGSSPPASTAASEAAKTQQVGPART